MSTSKARSHDLFNRYSGETVTLSSGSRFRAPYHCYDADAVIISGTVALGGARRLLENENCAPVVLRRSGAPDRGIAQIWLNLYRDTNVGPYREVVISFTASSEATTPLVEYVNPVSLVSPNIDPRCVTFTRWLYLDSQLAIDAGREVWGFPKYMAEVFFNGEATGNTGLFDNTTLKHRTVTADGKEVLQTRLVLEQSRWERLEVAWQVMRALGVGTLASLARESEAESTILTPVLLKQVVTPVKTVGSPALHPWRPENELTFGSDTQGGRALAELDFEPLLVQAIPQLKFIMLADDPRAMAPIHEVAADAA